MFGYILMYMKSKLGMGLAGGYVVIAVYFIATQGLFGESFIALILGMPWTLALAAIEFGGAEGIVAVALLVASMMLNTVILYWIGSRLSRLFARA